MQFTLLTALALAPLALAFGPGYYDEPVHAIIARDLSGLKADLYTLERRFAEASFDDEDAAFGGLSARSALDEDEYLDMLFRRAFPATPLAGQSTRGGQHIDGNLGRIDKKLGQFRKGTETHTTADKHAEIERLQSNREKNRPASDRYYG